MPHRFPLVPVDPVTGHGRAVKGLEGKAERSASEDGLFYVSDFLRAVVLVELLEVHDTEVAEGYGDGFQLARVVEAVELDGLPSGDVCESVGLLLLLPEMPDAHAVDDPVVLGPDAGGDGVSHLAQHHAVDVRHPHEEQHHFGGGEGGLERAASAVAQILVVLTRPDGRVGGVVFRDDEAAEFQLLLEKVWGPPSLVCHPQTPPFRRSPAAPGVLTSARGRGSSDKSTSRRGRRSGPS